MFLLAQNYLFKDVVIVVEEFFIAYSISYFIRIYLGL